MEDLFKTAGINPTEALPSGTTRGGEKRKQRQQGEREYDTTEFYGGHNLRQVIHSREPYEETLVSRPRTALASTRAADIMQHTTMDAASASHQDQAVDDYDEEEYAEGDDKDGEDDMELSDDENDDLDSKRHARPTRKSPTPPSTPTPATAPSLAAAPPASNATSIPLTTVKPDSHLG